MPWQICDVDSNVIVGNVGNVVDVDVIVRRCSCSIVVQHTSIIRHDGVTLHILGNTQINRQEDCTAEAQCEYNCGECPYGKARVWCGIVSYSHP